MATYNTATIRILLLLFATFLSVEVVDGQLIFPLVTSYQPEKAYPGETLTVMGSGFPSNSFSITIGGIACAPSTFVSSRQGTCVVPSALGSGCLRETLAVSGAQSIVPFNCAVPEVTQAQPSKAYSGDTITISGLYFGQTAAVANPAVAVAGQTCTEVSWTSPESVTCRVPLVASGAADLDVTIAGQTGTGSRLFSYNSPTVTSISPGRGYSPSTITLFGSHFGDSSTHELTVSVGGTPCLSSSRISSTISTCIVPRVPTGPQDVGLSVAGSSFLLPSSFVYETPVITAVTPTRSYDLDTLTIDGLEFGPSDTHSIEASVGGRQCISTSWVSATKCWCVVPSGLSPGGQDVAVTVGGISHSIGSLFTYMGPTVTGVIPSSGYSTDTLTIQGSEFGTSNVRTIKAAIGGIACSSTLRVSDTGVLCVVPAEAGSNMAMNATVTVSNTASGTTPAPVFTYNTPTVTAVSPTSAFAGDTITLSGKWFGSGSGTPVAATMGEKPCLEAQWISEEAIRCRIGDLHTGTHGARMKVHSSASATNPSIFESLGFRPPECTGLRGVIRSHTLTLSWSSSSYTAANSGQHFNITMSATAGHSSGTNTTVDGSVMTHGIDISGIVASVIYVYVQGHSLSGSSETICHLTFVRPAIVAAGCPKGKIRCFDGQCYPYNTPCASASPCGLGETLCNDMTCTSGSCPAHDGCPIGQARCYNGACVTDTTECSLGCTSGEVLCADNSCAAPSSCKASKNERKPLHMIIPVYDAAGIPIRFTMNILDSADESSVLAVVELPTGALANLGKSVFMSVSSVADSALPAMSSSATTFSASAVVNITFVDSDGGYVPVASAVPLQCVSSETDTSKLSLSYLSESTGEWITEDATVVGSTGTTGVANSFTGSASHFTAYTMTSLTTTASTSQEDSEVEWWVWLLVSVGVILASAGIICPLICFCFIVVAGGLGCAGTAGFLFNACLAKCVGHSGGKSKRTKRNRIQDYDQKARRRDSVRLGSVDSTCDVLPVPNSLKRPSLSGTLVEVFTRRASSVVETVGKFDDAIAAATRRPSFSAAALQGYMHMCEEVDTPVDDIEAQILDEDLKSFGFKEELPRPTKFASLEAGPEIRDLDGFHDPKKVVEVGSPIKLPFPSSVSLHASENLKHDKMAISRRKSLQKKRRGERRHSVSLQLDEKAAHTSKAVGDIVMEDYDIDESKMHLPKSDRVKTIFVNMYDFDFSSSSEDERRVPTNTSVHFSPRLEPPEQNLQSVPKEGAGPKGKR